MRWQAIRWRDGRWEFGREYDDESFALAAMCFDTGLALCARVEDNGSYRVLDCATLETVGCIRPVGPALPTCPVGGVPEGPVGPLRRWRGLTWVGWLNFLVLRWFLVRVKYTVEEDGTISKYGLSFVPSWRW